MTRLNGGSRNVVVVQPLIAFHHPRFIPFAGKVGACAVGITDMVTVNVLEDDDVRQAIKDFSNWPTVPQLYMNGEFIGGSDIVYEMYQSGELQKMVDGAKAA